MSAIASINLVEVAAQWRSARRIYPIYSALVRKFDIELQPCRELESPIDRAEPEVLDRVDRWLNQMDEKVQVFQLRQLLQTSHLATEENLRDLILRHLAKPVKSATVRDKVDYLLVQYYAHCAPHTEPEVQPTYEQVAEVLRAVLRDVPRGIPDVSTRLEEILKELEQCANLGDLLDRKIVENAREVKAKAQEKYFSPAALVAFARFNYLLRLGFFRLMHADLHSIRIALHELERRGQLTVDCTNAGMSAEESLIALRLVCHDWKTPFRAAYSAANNFRQIVEILAAVRLAMTQPPPATVIEETREEIKTDQPAAIESKQEHKQVENAHPAAAPIAEPELANPVEQQAQAANTVNGGAAKSKKAAQPKSPIVVKMKSPSPKPSVEAGEAPANVRAHAGPNLEEFVTEISAQLGTSASKSASGTTVMISESKLLLASWEVAAFVRGDDLVSESLKRAVAMRAILQLAIECRKTDKSLDLKPAIGLGHGEASVMQERIAEAKDQKNIDAAVNLAATAKRLLGMLEQAEKL